MRPLTFRTLSQTVVTLAAATALLGCASAHACKFRPDPRPWPEQVANAAGPVFLGHVESVSEGKAAFKVEAVVRGTTVPPGARLTVPMGLSSCHLRFSAGQRWLFAGGSQLDASRLLADGELPEEVRAVLARQPERP